MLACFGRSPCTRGVIDEAEWLEQPRDPLRVERANEAFEAGLAARVSRPPPGVRPDGVAVFGIDNQVSFCHPDGGLYVPGAEEDTQRAARWIVRHADRIDQLVFSLDTHRMHQVFHRSWWRTADGAAPEPLTVIRAEDVREGRFVPADPAERERALEYCRKLEATGRYVLTIWPFHGMLGGVSWALMPALVEAALFHAAYRGQDPRYEMKGQHPLTEHFSVFRPEVEALQGERLGKFNRNLFDALMRHERVFVFGQAKSHCVLSTVRDLVERVEAERPEALSRLVLLEDATSPVPPPPSEPLPPELDFPRIADEAFEDFRRRGVRIRKTTDEFD